jgi:hypothetical protein
MEDIEKTYKEISRVRAILLFLFSKKRFIDLSIKHDAGLTITEEKDLREKWLAGQYKPDENKLRNNATKRTDNLKKSFLLSGLFVLGSVIAAYFTGICLTKLYSPATDAYIKALQVIGAALLLWPTLWELGWHLRSWGGSTLPERTHNWIFRTLYILGTYSLFLSVTW